MDGDVDYESETVIYTGSWGPWSLGDLVDVARSAAELLGSGTTVQRIGVEQPKSPLSLPKVLVVVADGDDVSTLRDRLTASNEDSPTRFCGNAFGGGWVAEADGLELHVAREPEEW